MSEHTARPPITAHALDTAIGKPARGLPLKLEQRSGGSRGGRFWLLLGSCETDEDGRAPNLLASGYVSTEKVSSLNVTHFPRSKALVCTIVHIHTFAKLGVRRDVRTQQLKTVFVVCRRVLACLQAGRATL